MVKTLKQWNLYTDKAQIATTQIHWILPPLSPLILFGSLPYNIESIYNT